MSTSDTTGNIELQRVTVSAAALHEVLVALNAEPYRIRELQATRHLDNFEVRQGKEMQNPINILVEEFNRAVAWHEEKQKHADVLLGDRHE